MKLVLVLVLLTCAMSLSLKDRVQKAAVERTEVKEAAAKTSAKEACQDGYWYYCDPIDGCDCYEVVW